MKEIDWANLSFGYMKTDYNVRCYYRDGKWGRLKFVRRRPSISTWRLLARTTGRKLSRG